MSERTSMLPDDWVQVWASTSGAEFIAWMRDQGITAPHMELLGYRISSYEPGEIELRWEVPRPLLNPAGIAHGGFLAAVLDDACGMGIASSYPHWVPQLTVKLDVDFLSPVHAGREHVISGRLVRRGRNTSVGDATITDPDGTLLARGTGVFQPNRRIVPREHWETLGLA